jgi:hypothetical protein
MDTCNYRKFVEARWKSFVKNDNQIRDMIHKAIRLPSAGALRKEAGTDHSRPGRCEDMRIRKLIDMILSMKLRI